MYLSSKVAACASAAALLAAALASPGPARAALAARAAFAGMRPTIVPRVPRFPASGIAPTIVRGGARSTYPFSSGTNPTLVRRYRRGNGGTGYGGGSLGYDGDFTTDAGGSLGFAPPDGGALPPPFVIPRPGALPADHRDRPRARA